VSSISISAQNQIKPDTVFLIGGAVPPVLAYNMVRKSILGDNIYKFTGIDGGKSVLEEGQIIRIAYSDGSVFVNENPYSVESVELDFNPNTGAIEYSGVVDFEGVSKKDLYKTYKRLPNGLVMFELKEEDNEGMNWQRYLGSFYVENGGKEIVLFDLTVFFKEEKIRYVLDNLLVGYYEAITNSAGVGIGPVGVGSSGTTLRSKFQILSQGDKRSVKKFWSPVKLNLERTIDIVKQQGEKFVEEDNW